MPVAKLHRYLFLGMVATIVLLVVQLAYTTHRLNRLESALREVDSMAEDALEIGKEIGREIGKEIRTASQSPAAALSPEDLPSIKATKWPDLELYTSPVMKDRQGKNARLRVLMPAGWKPIQEYQGGKQISLKPPDWKTKSGGILISLDMVDFDTLCGDSDVGVKQVNKVVVQRTPRGDGTRNLDSQLIRDTGDWMMYSNNNPVVFEATHRLICESFQVIR